MEALKKPSRRPHPLLRGKMAEYDVDGPYMRGMDIKRYSWSFNEGMEVWGSDTFDTIAACIEDAGEVRDRMADDGIDPPNAVFIGENIPFTPCVDAGYVLDVLEEQAGEMCGEVGYEWDACDFTKYMELEELSTALTAVVQEWLRKYGYEPEIYAVENITKHPLPPYVKLAGACKRAHAGEKRLWPGARAGMGRK